MTRSVELTLGTSLVLALACTPRPTAEKLVTPPIREDQFVRVVGRGFVVNGDVPFRFVGANAAIMHGTAAREGAEEVLDAIARDALSVVRIWALGEADGDGRDWQRTVAFRLGPDEWVEESFVHLDHVLAAARERNLRVVVVLANRWGDRGGFPQYLRWTGVEPRRRNLLPAELTHVLTDELARKLYRTYVERIVTRTNTVNHVAYRDDPTIFSWELANELGAQDCTSQRALVAWTREMSELVRRLDPNHLVAAGQLGWKDTQGLAWWTEIASLPDVSYVDHHVYPESLASHRVSDIAPLVDDRANVALNVLGRPLVIGEVGVPRTAPFGAHRSELLSSMLARFDADGVAGAMVWIYRPDDERDDRHGIWPSGTRAEESTDTRTMLRARALAWVGREVEITNARVRDATPTDALGSRELETYLPWPEGEWHEGQHAWNGALNPWAFAEGCVEAAHGELGYAIEMPFDGPPLTFEVTTYGLPTQAHLALRVEVDGVFVGTFDDNGAYHSEDASALERAFGHATREHYLRFVAAAAGAAAHLDRFTRELPGLGLLAISTRPRRPPAPVPSREPPLPPVQ